MSAVATTRYPRLAIASGQTTRWKSAVDGEGEPHTGRGLPPLPPRSGPITPGVYRGRGPPLPRSRVDPHPAEPPTPCQQGKHHPSNAQRHNSERDDGALPSQAPPAKATSCQVTS